MTTHELVVPFGVGGNLVETPDVSIVIVNWNRLDDVLTNLHYLRFQSGVRYEVVVVDDGSTDGSAEWLVPTEHVKVVSLGSNAGPCRARNVGIANARGRYILFLDSDALLSKWSLARLVERMDADPTVGVLACRIINGHTRQLDQWIHGQPELTHHRREFETYSFSAAGAMIRADAVREAGCFWDQLFIYNEEVDLSIRILRLGYRILYYPDVKVYHFPSDRGRRGPSAYWRYQIRNWIWICFRYYPSVTRVFRVTRHISVYLIKSAVRANLRNCLVGIVEGLSNTDIIHRFPDKLTRAELRRIDSLNIRTKIRFDR